MAAQIPSKIFCRRTCQNANKFGLQHYDRVGMLIILWKSCGSHDQKCVKMADLVNYWEHCINAFKNHLLQTHPSECYQIWVSTFGQGLDVKLQRSCLSHDRKCIKMADFIKILENRVNTFKNHPPQTHQLEFHQTWVTALG